MPTLELEWSPDRRQPAFFVFFFGRCSESQPPRPSIVRNSLMAPAAYLFLNYCGSFRRPLWNRRPSSSSRAAWPGRSENRAASAAATMQRIIAVSSISGEPSTAGVRRLHESLFGPRLLPFSGCSSRRCFPVCVRGAAVRQPVLRRDRQMMDESWCLGVGKLRTFRRLSGLFNLH